MANPKQIVQPSDLPLRKSHSQVGAVTGGTLVFIAARARMKRTWWLIEVGRPGRPTL